MSVEMMHIDRMIAMSNSSATIANGISRTRKRHMLLAIMEGQISQRQSGFNVCVHAAPCAGTPAQADGPA